MSASPFTSRRFDYRATADYGFTRDLHGYFEFATGFKGGGVNPRPYYVEQIRTFAPESVNSYEIGLKSDLLDHHVRLNGDVFYNNYKDMQLTLFACPQYVPAGAPPNCYLPANVGSATIKGAEAWSRSRVRFGGLSFNASASYVDLPLQLLVDPAAEIALTEQGTLHCRGSSSTQGIQYRRALGGTQAH